MRYFLECKSQLFYHAKCTVTENLVAYRIEEISTNFGTTSMSIELSQI